MHNKQTNKQAEVTHLHEPHLEGTQVGFSVIAVFATLKLSGRRLERLENNKGDQEIVSVMEKCQSMGILNSTFE